MTASTSQNARPGAALPAVSAAAFALTMMVLAAGEGGVDLSYVVRAPRVTAWCILIAGQVSLWVLVVPTALEVIERHRDIRSAHPGFVGQLLVGLVILCALFIGGHTALPEIAADPVLWHRPKMIGVTVVGFVPLLALFVAMHLTALAAEAETTEDAVARYVDLRETLRLCLGLTGLIVAAATLATGALQETVAMLIETEPERVRAAAALPSPGERHMYTLIYGGFGCGFVALVYLPALARMRRAGRVLRDAVVQPPQKHGVDEWRAWAEARASLGQLLGVEARPQDLLKDGLALLAPFAGSAVSLLTHFG